MVKTKKGFHFYFQRTPLCDLYALYDYSRPFGQDGEEIDFKTICSTGTAGLVVVPPSTDKKWGRRLWKNEIPLFEGDIFNYFVENWADKKYKNVSSDDNGSFIREEKIDPQFIFESYSTYIIPDNEKNMITFLINSLSDKRAEAYGTWIKVGWCLKNICYKYDPSHNEWFFGLWNTFSKKSNKYVEREVRDIWVNTVPRKNGIDIGSLRSWSKEDDPEEYEKFFKKKNKEDIDEIIIKPHNIEYVSDDDSDKSIVYIENTNGSIKELALFSATYNETHKILGNYYGFNNVIVVNHDKEGYNFNCGKECKCPLCMSKSHGDKNWYMRAVYPRVYIVKNYHKDCKSKIYGWDSHRTLQDLLKNPDTDGPYVEAFKLQCGSRLFHYEKQWYFYRNHLWRREKKEEVYNALADMSKELLERLLFCLHDKKIELDLHGDESKETKDERKLIKLQYANILKGTKYIQKNHNVKNIREMAENRLYRNIDDAMDVDPYLLGCENGILVLEEENIHFRAGKPDDMISLSVGYNYFDDSNVFDNEIWNQVESFVKQIYPIDEEREIIQIYFGYCLLGLHNEKFALMLTDLRSGFNAKSTITKLLRYTLGKSSYSKKSDSSFIYKSDININNRNGHSSNLLAYDKKRVAIFEELDKDQKLDNALIKDITGSDSSFEGRECGDKKQNYLEWITKVIMCFNEGALPQINYVDSALCERFIVVNHRSKFIADYNNDEVYPPFTYPAISNMKEKLMLWRPYFLKWCIKGLEIYYEKGFKHIPSSCKDFKKIIIGEQNLVKQFIDKYLINDPNDDTIYVKKTELYNSFKDKYPQEKIKKYAIGPKDFFKQLLDLLGHSCYKDRYSINRTRDVFLGWKYRSLDD